MVSTMKEDGCTKVQVTNDKEVYGAGLAQAIVMAAKEQGLDVIANEGIDKNAAQLPLDGAGGQGGGCRLLCVLGRDAEQRGAAVQGLRGGDSQRQALRARRHVRVGLHQHQDGHPGQRGRALQVHLADVAGRSNCHRPVSSSSRTTRRSSASTPDPYSIYGYESMQLALDAIKRSKTGEKADIIKALFATKDRSSALGTYSIDANGDTSLTEMALDGVEDGKLTFIKVIKGSAL